MVSACTHSATGGWGSETGFHTPAFSLHLHVGCPRGCRSWTACPATFAFLDLPLTRKVFSPQSLLATLFGGGPMPLMYESDFRCYSMAYVGRPELEAGDKVLLPSSALAVLSRIEVQYPMMFRLQAMGRGDKRVHVGVYEFSASEGQVVVPGWLMRGQGIAEGALVSIRNVQLPKGTYVKVRPHTKDFIELSDPRAVLEKHLRRFSCLTRGTSICLHLDYLGKDFLLEILELKPADAVSIIETDIVLDFAPPKDYVEPPRPVAGAGAGAGAGSDDVVMGGAGAGFASPDTKRSVADDAAARRSGGEPAAPSPSRFPPKMVPFAGEGRTLGGPAAAAAPAPASSPTMSGGGVVLSGGAGSGGKARPVNRFEEARRAKAASTFAGAGRSLQ
jgi:ubiquitin fusion degradation protein 1